MKRLLACAAALALQCTHAVADPGYYVVTVYDNPGIRTLDFRYWAVHSPGSPVVDWPEVGFGWNVTGRWFSELFFSYIGSPAFATRLSTVNWQNDFLLTQGQYPIDLALHTQLVKSQHDSPGDAFEFGPVIQTDIGRTQLNFNVFFERAFGNHAPQPTQLKYQWQVRHRWKPGLHIGAQGFGELGQWDNWAPRDQQSHRAGPALFGSLRTNSSLVSWQAAYLVGSTYAAHGSMLTVRAKFEF